MAGKTVKQLAMISGVSVRTLHHYDAIGLLTPAYVGENGYRYYERKQMLRLQQILFYRQLDTPLDEIRQTLDANDFDSRKSLQMHRERLVNELERQRLLTQTIDETINELSGDNTMEMENPYKGFDLKKQAAYEKEIEAHPNKNVRAHFAEAKANVSKMSTQQHDAIHDVGHGINLELVECLKKGETPDSERVQNLIARHHAWVCNYWEPDAKAYVGLSQQYYGHPEFKVFYDRYDERLVDFLAKGMVTYAQNRLN